MFDFDFDLVAIAFTSFNFLRLISYFPQIAVVWRDPHGATAISLASWAIWVGANATTALYAWVNLNDPSLSLLSAFNAGCCIAVLLLATWKRTEHRFRSRSATFRPQPGFRSAP